MLPELAIPTRARMNVAPVSKAEYSLAKNTVLRPPFQIVKRLGSMEAYFFLFYRGGIGVWTGWDSFHCKSPVQLCGLQNVTRAFTDTVVSGKLVTFLGGEPSL